MSERRYDPTADEWVTLATDRQDRTYQPPEGQCPLCPTPAGTPADRATEIPRSAFEIAVFDNRFPSLRVPPPEPSVEPTPLYPVASSYGHCEVVVYSDDHDATLTDLPTERIALLVGVWTDRYVALGADPGVHYVMPFENKGEVIGVTLSHPHGQTYAYPEVPPRPARELAAARRHHERTGRCVECDVVAAEAADGRRVVAGTERFVAWVPFWARFPYEVHLAPREHRTCLPELDLSARWELAGLLRRVLVGYDALFGFSLPYVLAIHQRPTDDGDWAAISHLHVELAPPHRSADKLKYLAGSELAGGAFVTDIAPEDAAARLRTGVPDRP